MAFPASEQHQITFKQWLKEVADTRNGTPFSFLPFLLFLLDTPFKKYTSIRNISAIKVNVRTAEVLKPALQYLFAYQEHLRSPIIVHADIMSGPASVDFPISPSTFISEASSLFPDATISVGWTKTASEKLQQLPQDDLR